MILSRGMLPATIEVVHFMNKLFLSRVLFFWQLFWREKGLTAALAYSRKQKSCPMSILDRNVIAVKIKVTVLFAEVTKCLIAVFPFLCAGSLSEGAATLGLHMPQLRPVQRVSSQQPWVS